MTLIARTLIIFLSITLLSDSAFPVSSEGFSRAMSPQDATAGTLLAHSNAGSPQYAVPLLATDVSINVTGMFSRTTVIQHFTNPSEEWLEGIYVFPLPTMSAVDTLRMKIGERTIVGQIKKRVDARQIYDKAKKSGRKATLLEQERPNIFTASVANIGPGETIEIRIEYQQELRYVDGVFSLRFPMVVGPRYTPDSWAVEGFSESGWGNSNPQSADTARITPPVVRRESDPINPVRIQARINAGFPSRIESPSHQITVKGDSLVSQIDLTDGVVPADSDFVLRWQPLLGKSPSAAFFGEVHNGDAYALIMLMPPSPQITPAGKLSRETIFIIDISGSMAGPSIVQAREALLMALERLSPADSFNIIPFSSDVYSLFSSSRKATPENITYAMRHVSQLEPGGGTEMMPALRLALANGSVDHNHVRQVVFITDGSVSNESSLFSYIKNHLGQSRLFTVGIGSAPNSYFMREAAEFGRGTFTYIGETNEVKENMIKLFSKLERPAVTGVEFDWNGKKVEHWPKQVPDLYLGEPIVIVAKLNDLSGQVRVHGQNGTTPWELTFTLKGGRKESGINRLFARRKIASLNAIIAGGANAYFVQGKITELGLAHHLVTHHTSLVAIEQAASRPDNTALDTNLVPTNLPKGWVYDRVFHETTQSASQDQRENRNFQVQASSTNHTAARSYSSSVTVASTVLPRPPKATTKIATKSTPSVTTLEISKDDTASDVEKADSKPTPTSAPATTTTVISNQNTQHIPQENSVKPSPATTKNYSTTQSTVFAKLREIMGFQWKTIAPTQVLFVLGLLLLLMTTWFRLRSNRI